METDFPSIDPAAATTAPASKYPAAETAAPCLDRVTGLASAAATTPEDSTTTAAATLPPRPDDVLV